MRSKFETHILPNMEKIAGWVKKGATAKECAAKLGIAYSTMKKYIEEGREDSKNYREEYRDFSALYAQACDVASDEVEASLFKLCNGYSAPVVKHYKVKRIEYDPDTGKKIAEYEELVPANDTVHVAANVVAQKFWLTNRKSSEWKNDADKTPNAEVNEGGVIELPKVKNE